MILYLSSQKLGNKEEYLKAWIKSHGNKMLLISNAMDHKSPEYRQSVAIEDAELLKSVGFDVTTIDLKDYFDKQEELRSVVERHNAFCIMGGNVFALRQAMKYSGLDKIIQEVAPSGNYLYIGYSAGCCVLSKDIGLFKNLDTPGNWYGKDEIINKGLGLIDYLFIPHYKSDYHKVHLIDELVNQCKKEGIKYKALSDGEVCIDNINERGIDK